MKFTMNPESLPHRQRHVSGRITIPLALGLAVAFCGCGPGELDGEAEAKLGQLGLALTDGPAECAAARFVVEEPLDAVQGLLEGATSSDPLVAVCPSVRGYDGAPLGRSASSVFCQYSASQGTVRPSSTPTLREVGDIRADIQANLVTALDRAGLSEAEATELAAGLQSQLDCPVVLPMGRASPPSTRGVADTSGREVVSPESPSPPRSDVIGPFSMESLGYLAEVVRNNVGWVPAGRSLAPVQVAVLDTENLRFDTVEAGVSKTHGRAVGQLIENLTCGGSSPSEPRSLTEVPLVLDCGLGIQNFQALALDESTGESRGRRGDLARALHSALDAHVAQKNRARLIVNLSLGWEGSGAQGDPASDAVYWALQRARCLDVLVIAAAGNTSPSSSSGPLYPAGWEAHAGFDPGSGVCSALLGSSDLAPTRDEERGAAPLIYAVSSVDHAGYPLVSTRGVDAATGLGGVPPRAALGLAMVTEQSAAESFTALWTGSSMSTAILSALAARVWGQDRSLDSREVMQRIDAGLMVPGAPTPSSLCLGGDNCPQSYGIARWCSVLGEACPPDFARPSQRRLRRMREEQSTASLRGSDHDVLPQPGPVTCSECSLVVLPSGGLRLDLRLTGAATPDALLLYDAAAFKTLPLQPSRTIMLTPGTKSISARTPLAAAVRMQSPGVTPRLEQLLIAWP